MTSTTRIFSGWTGLAWLLALPAVAVIAVVIGGMFKPAPDDMAHILQYVLPTVVPNTVLLVLSVTILATVIGVWCAWLVTFYDFPLRRIFNWSLLLPLAFPGYVLAFIYLGLFDYAGPLQSWLRMHFELSTSDANSSSLPGLVAVLTLALFPYVFLLTRSGFASQGKRALEVAYSCQMSTGRAFFKAVLPLSLPWILGGSLLVAMETLADFGAVSVFNFDTFTTVIYKTWFSLFSLTGALRLAGFLLLFVAVLILVDRYFASRKKLSMKAGGAVQRVRLKGMQAGAAALSLGMVLMLAVIIPTAQLVWWSAGTASNEWQSGYGRLLGNTLVFSLGAAVLISLVAILLVYAVRQNNNALTRTAVRIAGLGYALPGTLLAVGVFIPLAALSKHLQSVFSGVGIFTSGLALQSVLLVTFIAYLVRFGAVALSPVENGMLRISQTMDDSARVLGVHGRRMLQRVHWPMLRVSVLTAALLVFVDVLKEMPITLMTRPFGWDTLAVRIFERTSEGQWAEAAPAALLIVFAGVIPIILLTRKFEHAVSHS